MYLRLLPGNGRTRVGKQHVKTAPAKLTSTENSKHQIHWCTKFARATINTLKELAEPIGPGDVTFHSQGDKAKVSIGLTTA